ncbi:MAG: hypothetical protein DWI10_07215 [Planctomycetota bacterium]|nr:MAG: hypothetical protein DWI10_07215 [Planctomycetota bacterium]
MTRLRRAVLARSFPADSPSSLSRHKLTAKGPLVAQQGSVAFSVRVFAPMLYSARVSIHAQCNLMCGSGGRELKWPSEHAHELLDRTSIEYFTVVWLHGLPVVRSSRMEEMS